MALQEQRPGQAIAAISAGSTLSFGAGRRLLPRFPGLLILVTRQLNDGRGHHVADAHG
jgi:hypothetical protein